MPVQRILEIRYIVADMTTTGLQHPSPAGGAYSAPHADPLAINQSTNQSIMLFRVVQVTKSLQDPLEVGNSLLGISHDVRK